MSLERRSFLARAGLATAAAALAPRAARALVDATGAVDWAAVRREFDLAPEWTHLATFFLVSHPRAVREAIERIAAASTPIRSRSWKSRCSSPATRTSRSG